MPMIVLAWNYRGLANPRAVQFLRDLVLRTRPNIVFLYENLAKLDKVDSIKNSMGFDGLEFIDCRGFFIITPKQR